MCGGWRHTVAVTSHGVYAWGWNKFGQLGIGTVDENPCVPHKLEVFAQSDDPIEHIAAGWKHTMFVTATGAVFATGRGNNGQLCMPVKADLCALKLLELLQAPCMSHVCCGCRLYAAQPLIQAVVVACKAFAVLCLCISLAAHSYTRS